MISMQEAVTSFHKLMVASCHKEVVIPRKSAKEARAFRQRCYRLRDVYLSVSKSPDASALAHQIEFKVIGRHLYVLPKDPDLAHQLLKRIS